MPMKLELACNCTHKDCQFGFPQFEIVKESEFRKMVERCIAALSDPTSYAYGAYKKNREAQISVLISTRTMGLVEACTAIEFFEGNFYCDRGYYLTSLTNRVAQYKPCCR